MSKRYGRQQKRKAKVTIEALQSKNNELELTLTLKNRKIQTAEYIIEIAREICPNSICFEPQVVDGNIWRVEKFDAPDFSSALGGDRAVNEPVDINCIDLHQLELSLSESNFDEAIHYEARLVGQHSYGKRSAYRISQIGFNSVPVKHIAYQLAKHLKQSD